MRESVPRGTSLTPEDILTLHTAGNACCSRNVTPSLEMMLRWAWHVVLKETGKDRKALTNKNANNKNACFFLSACFSLSFSLNASFLFNVDFLYFIFPPFDLLLKVF